MYLLLYSHEHDPVVRSLKRSALKLQNRLCVVPLQLLLNEIMIDDQVKDGIPTVRWTLPNGEQIRNTSEVKFINRVLGLPDALFADFHPQDQKYAMEEFSAYLTFSISSFPKNTAQPGYLGIGGNQYPLPYQWKKINESLPHLQVPSYYIGPRGEVPFDLAKEKVVQSSIFQFQHWRPTTTLQEEDTDLLFLFLRPPGVPYLCLVCGDQTLVCPAQGKDGLGPEVKGKLADWGKAIARCLEHTMGEILYFVDGDQVYFGAATRWLQGTCRHTDFDRVLQQGLESIFQEGWS